MQFFSAVTGLYLASMAVAAPADIQPRQGPTAVSTIDTSINALVPTVPRYASAIQSSVATIQQSTSVQTEIVIAAEAAINANLGVIISSLNDTVNTIVAVTINATGGVIVAAQGLAQADINQLQSDIAILENIIASFNATLTATASLEASVRATYQAEVTAFANLLQPFINPIILFAQAAIAVTAGASVTGLAVATVGLQSIANNFYQSVGLPASA
ncbi:hypothetical protein N0V93_004457 [Gnomoniopsis smithogilvyi]|uniref:Uncharacterized protein n=1 Tax=Gnomoniopsis smithogilvyi TaxID=1191159 RepID=A0A9W9CW79_9PEZI|nr:hypothetical protein N0V93_004457 [Gnomoniopsis smithogilvyi]